MATDKEVQNAMNDAAIALAKKAADAPQATTALKFAMAANNLVEAAAWSWSPGQAHGGTSYADAK